MQCRFRVDGRPSFHYSCGRSGKANFRMPRDSPTNLADSSLPFVTDRYPCRGEQLMPPLFRSLTAGTAAILVCRTRRPERAMPNILNSDKVFAVFQSFAVVVGFSNALSLLYLASVSSAGRSRQRQQGNEAHIKSGRETFQ
jgi:hypothetical protein